MSTIEFPLFAGSPLMAEVSPAMPLPVGSFSAPIATQIDNSAVNNQPLYIGTAKAGSATSAGAWRIQKLTYDANGNVSAITWANVDGNGVPSSAEVWDNRAGLAYS